MQMCFPFVYLLIFSHRLYDFNAETSVGPKVKFWYLVLSLTVSFKVGCSFLSPITSGSHFPDIA